MLTSYLTDLMERDPEAHVKEIWCYMPGEPCYKAKREAIAIAQEHEDAESKHLLSSPSHTSTSFKISLFPLPPYFRRNILTTPLIELAKRSPEAHVKEIWCYRVGEPCYKVRRAAMALVAAVTEKEL